MRNEEVTMCYMVRESTDSGFYAQIPNEIADDGDPYIWAAWIENEFGEDWIPMGMEKFNSYEEFEKDRDDIDNEIARKFGE